MRKFMQHTKGVSILIIGLLFLMVSVVEAANIITNGDFNNGTTDWTTDSGNLATPGNCAPNVAHITTPMAGETAQISQCVLITNHDTNWTLNVDLISSSAGNTGLTQATFHTASDCNSGTIHTANNTLGSPSITFPYDSMANGVQSARVRVIVNNISGPVDVCIDNLSLSGAVATAVSMHAIGTQPHSNNDGILLLIGLGLLLVTLLGTTNLKTHGR